MLSVEGTTIPLPILASRSHTGGARIGLSCITHSLLNQEDEHVYRHQLQDQEGSQRSRGCWQRGNHLCSRVRSAQDGWHGVPGRATLPCPAYLVCSGGDERR